MNVMSNQLQQSSNCSFAMTQIWEYCIKTHKKEIVNCFRQAEFCAGHPEGKFRNNWEFPPVQRRSRDSPEKVDPETVQRQSRDNPETGQRQSRDSPKTVQRQSSDSFLPVQRQSRDSPERETVHRTIYPWGIKEPHSQGSKHQGILRNFYSLLHVATNHVAPNFAFAVFLFCSVC